MQNLTDTEFATLKMCSEDVQYNVGGLACSMTGAQLDAVRKLYRLGLVEWKLPSERSGAGYKITEAGRITLATRERQ